MKNRISLLLPTFCLGCERLWKYLCVDCKKTIHSFPDVCPGCKRFSNGQKTCPDCQLEWIKLDGCMIAWRYEKIVKKIIRAIKFRHAYEVTSAVVETLGYCLLANERLHGKEIVMTRVPSSDRKVLWTRGFCQTKIRAEKISKQFWITNIALLTKHDTKSQISLWREKRAENIKNSFSVNSHDLDLNKKIIVIVDDIITTGSTLHACTVALKKQRPDCIVRWLTLSRNA